MDGFASPEYPARTLEWPMSITKEIMSSVLGKEASRSDAKEGIPFIIIWSKASNLAVTKSIIAHLAWLN